MKSSILFSSMSVVLSFHLYAAPVEYNTWEMYQGNAQHTGYVPITIAPDKIKRIWQSHVESFEHQAIIGDNAIYVSRANHGYLNTLQAISMDTGNKLWAIDFKDLRAQPPLYHDGKIFIQALGYYSSTESSFQAFDENGKLLFKTAVFDSFGNAGMPIINNGIIYADSDRSSAIAYNEKTGEKLGEYEAYDLYHEPNSPSLIDNVLMKYGNHMIHIYDISTSQLTTRIPLAQETYPNHFSPIICDHQSFMIDTRGGLSKINFKTKSIIFSIPDIDGVPAVDNENIYAIKNNRLAAIDKLSGKTKWIFYEMIFDKSVHNIIITNNLIFVSDDYGTSAISKDTHNRLWKTLVHGEMSLSNKGLFIVSDDGTLTRFSILAKDDETDIQDLENSQNMITEVN